MSIFANYCWANAEHVYCGCLPTTKLKPNNLFILSLQQCSMLEQKHIVIIGAGFAGLKLARMLNNNPHYSITLIDKNNYHQFQPLFYQVATASLDASNISFPLRKIFQKSKNVRIKIGVVNEILVEENLLKTSIGNITYDYLIIATGADTNYFGNTHIMQNAYPMKTTVEALQLRTQLIENFEQAALTTNKDVLQKLLNIVIVGGGPTGIELSGALAEMKRYILPKEYPEIDFSNMSIYLLEGSDRVLGAMSNTSSIKSKKYLEDMGVTICTHTIVKDYDGNQIFLQNGEIIPTSLVIWAAGVKGNVLNGIDKTLIAPGNRIKVDEYNKIINTKNIYAVGDIAFMESEAYPKGHPQLASVAIDQAKNLSLNLKRMALANKVWKVYTYKNKGAMATVGRSKAVVELEKPKINIYGSIAWLIWMTVHLFLLMGFKNRIMVFINWGYKYFTFDQSLRLIFSPLSKFKNK